MPKHTCVSSALDFDADGPTYLLLPPFYDTRPDVQPVQRLRRHIPLARLHICLILQPPIHKLELESSHPRSKHAHHLRARKARRNARSRPLHKR